MTLKREDLESTTEVYYYDQTVYSFISNWTEWHIKDTMRYDELDEDASIFGAIIDGLFHYVEDTK